MLKQIFQRIAAFAARKEKSDAQHSHDTEARSGVSHLDEDDDIDDDVDHGADAHLSEQIVEAIESGGIVTFEHFSNGSGKKMIACALHDGHGGVGMTPGEALARALSQDPPSVMVKPFVVPDNQPTLREENLDPLIETLVAMARRAAGEMQSRQLREAFDSDLKSLLKEHGRA